VTALEANRSHARAPARRLRFSGLKKCQEPVTGHALKSSLSLVDRAGHSAGSPATMPRRIRIEFEAAIYHVMPRGNARQDILQDDDDRRRLAAPAPGPYSVPPCSTIAVIARTFTQLGSWNWRA
jgi:hypothetical protein